MKKTLNKTVEAIILAAASVLNLLLTVIFYSIRLSDFSMDEYERGQFNMWNAKEFVTEIYILRGFNIYFVISFLIGLALLIVGIILLFVKKKKLPLFIFAAFSAVTDLAFIVINIVLGGIFRTSTIVFMCISALLCAGIMTFIILRKEKKQNVAEEENGEYVAETPKISEKQVKGLKIGALVCECLASIALLLIFVTPIYKLTDFGETTSYSLIQALNANSPLAVSILFLVAVIACFATLLYFVSTLSYFTSATKTFIKKARKYVVAVTLCSLIFFIAGFGVAFGYNLYFGKSDANAGKSASTAAYVPVILTAIVLIAFSAVQGRLEISDDEKNVIGRRKFKIEPYLYVLIMTAITFLALAINVVTIEFNIGDYFSDRISLNGYKLLTTYKDLEAGFQVFAFALFAFLLTSGSLFVMSTISLIAKNKGYYKVLKISAIVNFAFCMAIGLFGVYFKIAQKVNEENFKKLLELYNFYLPNLSNYEYTITSQSIYLFAGSLVFLSVMLARGQFNLVMPEITEIAVPYNNENAAAKKDRAVAAENKDNQNYNGETVSNDFDSCPAFTELDGKRSEFAAELERKRGQLFNNITLPNLVRFVVDYARECRLHLSYSLEDMATFVAGLGASRLTILQGMSGTGKTSLPKIFTEAIMGTCEIVEVESSWRDKNELLGYYNEFSKCYTPKKFTQCLYKARLNSTVPTFIVLDEMNLSRIEYYFSDFLSLMENEEDKREIKLLNVKLCRTENGERISYDGLTDGHTIKIPKNVWFIGTANRDESTFEISDKVYDRAQTMNFNKRAPKIHSFSEPLPQKFASYEMLMKLFEEAKTNYVFEAEDNVLIQKAEKLLAPYNISFGNRILKQMEDFVKIYCACFGDKDAVLNDAVEKILLSKVVSKLETKIVENKDALAAEFNKLGLTKCSAFVQKLNED